MGAKNKFGTCFVMDLDILIRAGRISYKNKTKKRQKQ